MSVVNVRQFSAVFGSLICLLSMSAVGQEIGDKIVKTGIHDGHLYLSGEDVSIRAEVTGNVIAMADDLLVDSKISGDLIAMAGDIDIDSDVAGELLALSGSADISGHFKSGATIMGGELDVEGEIVGPVFIAGGSIETSGSLIGNTKLMGGKVKSSATVEGDLLAAAAKVELTERSVVSGKVWATGAKVEVYGIVGGELRIAARKAEVGGRIEGDVHIDAVEIEIMPSTVIAGSLHYRSSEEAEIDPSVTIAGDVVFERSDRPLRTVGIAHAGIAMFLLATIGGLILLGAVQILLCPNFSVEAARTIHARPWPTLGLGFAILVAAPVLTFILFGIIVGIPLGLALIALYVLLVLAGLLVSSTAIGMKVIRLFGRSTGDRFWSRFGVLVLGVLILAVVTVIPILGAIVFCISLSFGIGAMVMKSRDVCVTP